MARPGVGEANCRRRKGRGLPEGGADTFTEIRSVIRRRVVDRSSSSCLTRRTRRFATNEQRASRLPNVTVSHDRLRYIVAQMSTLTAANSVVRARIDTATLMVTENGSTDFARSAITQVLYPKAEPIYDAGRTY
jgi:hypothetical protein